jgi:two-component sensor histidine kinase
MVSFSGRNALDVVTFVASVRQRLHSMAKTHTLLTNSSWIGASLRTLFDNELAAHIIPGACAVSVRGAEFELDPKAAQATSMALHELVTNAVKHGCLADADGRLDVTWEMEDSALGRALVIRWKEVCSRKVVAPTRRGFGRLLLEKLFSYDVGGRLTLEFESDGLRCQLAIPESHLAKRLPTAKLVAKPEPLMSMGRELTGLRVLVVEDGALVAQNLAEWLSAAGASVVGPCATLREAAEAGRGQIDVALLDVDVDGAPVWSLARDLRARGVPCVFTTGFSTEIERPADFIDILMVNKPYDLTRLHLAISTSLGQSVARTS